MKRTIARVGKRGRRNRIPAQPGGETPVRVPKLCGSDSEMGNFVLGSAGGDGTGHAAARALLSMVDGVGSKRGWTSTYGHGWSGDSDVADGTDGGYAGSSGAAGGYGYTGSYAGTHAGSYAASAAGYDPQDIGRKYLARNGSSIYIDLGHLEVCTPEVLSAWDHHAAYHAMLRITQDAQRRVNERLGGEAKVQVLAANSDGRSNSYGSHLSILLTRTAWDDIFRHRLHLLLYLASFQVSSQVITGQGKVGSENRQPTTSYQLSQRADFFEALTGAQTTYRRPIVNSRDETLCGWDGQGAEVDSGLARIHCIFYDQNLCHVAGVLKVGMMQIVLAMLESGYVNMERILDNPLAAVAYWSHGADLDKRCRTVSRESLTAVELQQGYVSDARVALEAGVLDTVPRAAELIDLWDETLGLLAARDFDVLAGRLDWVLKRHAIERCLSQRSALDWGSHEIKYLDQMYSSLDPAEGLYWAFEQSGLVERLVTDEQIAALVVDPPTDTRAWTRAMLLRELDPNDVYDIDWHRIKVSRRREGGFRDSVVVGLGDPLGSTRADNGHIFSDGATTDQILDGLRDAVGEPEIDAADEGDEGDEGEEDEAGDAHSHLRPLADTSIH